jgi:exodeoxyribonuclease VII small subunit
MSNPAPSNNATPDTSAGDKKKPQPTPKSFEAAMTELERILADMDSGQTTLEASLAQYERGTFLIKHCRQILTQAEKQMEELTRDEQGNLATSGGAGGAEG